MELFSQPLIFPHSNIALCPLCRSLPSSYFNVQIYINIYVISNLRGGPLHHHRLKSPSTCVCPKLLSHNTQTAVGYFFVNRIVCLPFFCVHIATSSSACPCFCILPDY